MWARRYLIETGHEPEDFGAIPVAQRAYAVDNPRAIIEGRGLVYDPDLPYTSTSQAGFLSRLRRLFKR